MTQNTSAVFNFRLETDGIGSLSYKPNCACFKGINVHLRINRHCTKNYFKQHKDGHLCDLFMLDHLCEI